VTADQRLDLAAEEGKDAGKLHLQPDDRLLDIDRRVHFLPHRRHREVHPVALPVGADLGAARKLVGEAAGAVLDSPLRLGGAEAVRQIDGDRIAHLSS
jgi:hypothetical protein